MDSYIPSQTKLNVHEVKMAFQRGRHKAIIFGNVLSEDSGAGVLAELITPMLYEGAGEEYPEDFTYLLLSFCDERNKDTLRPIVDDKSGEIVGVNLFLADGKGTRMVISEGHDAYLTGAVISGVRLANADEIRQWEAANGEEDDEDGASEDTGEEDSLIDASPEEGPSDEELAALEAATAKAPSAEKPAPKRKK